MGRGGTVCPVTETGTDFLSALKPFLDHPVLVSGKDAFNIRHQFLVLIVQVVYALWGDDEGVRLLKSFLDPCPILFVAATEAIIVHDHDGVIKIVFDVLQQPLKFGPEVDAVGTSDFPIDHVAPTVLTDEVGQGSFVLEQDIFLAAGIIAALA